MTFAERRDRAAAELGRLILQLPDGVLRTLAGSPPPQAAGLEPGAWALARLTEIGVPDEPLPDEEARRVFEIRCAAMGRPPETPVETRDLRAGGVPARLYVPQAAGGPGPLLVFFHGGGWVQGSLESHDAGCRNVADRAGVRVLAVDYRLAPEHRFPAAFDDALAAYGDVTERPEAFGAAAGRIAVGGDSAGGNLAAAVALHGRPVPAFLWALYPVTDAPDSHESYRTFAEGFYLSTERMRYLFDRYAPDPAERHDPRVAPLRARDLSGLPPAYVATSMADPLRDEGEAFAACLTEAGVAADLVREPLLHGFLNTTALRTGRAGVFRAADALRRGLAASRLAPSPSETERRPQMAGHIDEMRKRYDAFNKGDMEGATELWADDFVWQGSNSTDLPGGGEHHGKDKALQVMSEAVGAWDEFELSADEFYEDGDTVVVLGHTNVSKGGDSAEVPVVHIWRWEGDEIKRLQILTDTHQTARMLGQG